jgi:DNA modification methylase
MVVRPTSSSPRLPRLALTYRSIDEIKPDPGNPRTRSRQVQRRVERSMAEFGFVFPITVDRHVVIVAGHARFEAAKTLGYTHVPTIGVEHLNENQIKALQIADNRLVELGTWDERLLGEALQSLTIQGIDLDVTLTGFDVPEIDLHIEGLSEKPDNEDPEALAPTADAKPVSRVGDLFLLGKHRLYCGNSLEAASTDAVMAGAAADAVFTDSPYNVKIDGHVSGLGEIKHREFPMASGEMKPDQFRSFLRASVEQMARVMKPGSVAFTCMDWRHADDLTTVAKAAGLDHINTCIWVKTAPGMGSLYRSQHEFVLVFGKPGASRRNNVQLGKYGRSRSNVWNYAGMTGFGNRSEEGNLLALHPTVKPVQMVADAILDVTARGEIVFDPFLGSGTALIAAERVGRRCYAIELDPLYVDLAIRRWQRLTGQTARHAETGKSFDEMSTERGS